ncbi:MAG: hypothetical protein ACKOBN_00170 [Flavobacteriales bacterium]
MKTTLLLLTYFVQSALFGQGCTIDYNQTLVGIYPVTLPAATVGIAYNTDVTFVLPTDTLGYPFTNFQIASINLPLGLNWNCNEALNNCNYNPQFDVYGCIHISGTPLIAGNFQIAITILADLTILQGYPYQFDIDFNVNPPVVMNSSGAFDYQLSQPCAPALVSFTNQEPGLAYYNWDFGNGAVSTLEQPPAQFYAAAGSYPIHYMAYQQLDTTILIQFEQLDLTQMSNYGENFPSFDEADTYFKVKKNGQLIYQSTPIIDQNPPLSWWPNINLELGQTYLLEIWEADQSIGENYFGADDYIGNHTLNISSCNGCFAGTAQIAYQITIQNVNPSPSFQLTDTIQLYQGPVAPQLEIDSIGNQISVYNNITSLQWYFNGQALLGQNDAVFEPEQNGYYHVLAVNQMGCWQSSDTIYFHLNTADASETLGNTNQIKVVIEPLTDQLFVHVHEGLIGAALEIWKLDGGIVYQKKEISIHEIVSLIDYPNGIYNITLNKGGVLIHRNIPVFH